MSILHAGLNRLGKILINRFPIDENPRPKMNAQEIEEQWKQVSDKKELIIGLSTGRSGLNWVMSIFGKHNACSGFTHPFPVEEAFYRYAIWNHLNIDHGGFFSLIKYAILKKWQSSDKVFFASPYLGADLSLVEQALNPKAYVLNLRNSEDVVNSMFIKNWYNQPSYKSNHESICGPQPQYQSENYHFSRITPLPVDQFSSWNDLSVIGKCSWYWSELNSHVLEQFNAIQKPKRLYKLEDIDQNYAFYQSFAKFFDLSPLLSEEEFINLKGKKKYSNQGKSKRKSEQWNKIEKQEYHQQTEPFQKLYSSLKSDI